MNPGMHFVMVLFVDLHLLRLSKPSTVNQEKAFRIKLTAEKNAFK